MTNSTYIKYLLAKYLQDQCTQEEIELLINYFGSDSSMPEVPSVEYVKYILNKEAPKMEVDAADKIYEHIVSNSLKKTEDVKKFSVRKNIVRYISVAAVVIGLIFTSGLVYKNTFSFLSGDGNTIKKENFITLQLGKASIQIINPLKSQEIFDNNGNFIGKQNNNRLIYENGKAYKELINSVLRVPLGKRFELELSDGTIVHLNSGTSLRFPNKFINGEKRQVFLSGEAFFDVTENKDMPFIVKTEDGMNVRVLGTSFNVKAYPEDENTETTLVEGKVKMYDESLLKEVVLKPSQKAIYRKVEEKLIVKEVNVSNFTAWKEGVLRYNETPINDVLKDLERTYNVVFEVKSKEILNYKYKGVFNNLTIDQILEVFKISSEIEYTKQNGKIILKNNSKKVGVAAPTL